MAIITSPKFGKMKNKVDGLVFQKYRTLQIMRDRVIPRNPRTLTQQKARTKFGTLANLAAILSPAIRLGLGEYVKGTVMGVRNAFVSLNKAMVSVSDALVASVDYTGIKIAKGSLTAAAFGEPDFSNPQEVTIAITGNTEAWDADDNDIICILCYAPDLNAIIVNTDAKRDDANVTITFPASWNGATVKMYGFVQGDGADNEGKISNSVYIGSGNVD